MRGDRDVGDRERRGVARQDRVLEESNENGPLIDPGVGGYNVLLVGDARLLPVPAVEYRDGVSYAVIGDRPLDIRDRWAAPDSDAADAVEMAQPAPSK